LKKLRVQLILHDGAVYVREEKVVVGEGREGVTMSGEWMREVGEGGEGREYVCVL
jgi:hypothetical protein